MNIEKLVCVALVPTWLACGPNESPKQPEPQPAASASAAPATPPAGTVVAPQSFKDLGAEVIAWLHAGEDGKVRALFADAMGKAMPTDDAVGQMWSGIEKKVGGFKKWMEATEGEKDEHHIVVATCEFAHAIIDVRLVFDKDRHLAGFFMQPTQNPRAYGPRPQHPAPPFPYDTREVTYENEKDGNHFAGTLSVPKAGTAPFPVVLLITGSGTQDRDETILGHKPFLVIADHLTKNGIAVLRVDDPGAGRSMGAGAATATIETHARDAEAGIAFLKTQKDIDPKRIGLAGHSEGSLIAAIVASHSKDVAYVVSLAGTGLSGAEINPMQVEAILNAQKKMKPEDIKAVVAAQRKIMKLIAGDADAKALNAAVKEAFAAAGKDGGADAQEEIAAGVKVLELPWYKSFVKLDPARYWSKVTVPVLAMNGDKDTQVVADRNLGAIKSALGKAKNKDVDIETLAGLNHLFQPAETGLLDEYGKIETTFDAKALDLMTEWLKKHALGTHSPK